MRSTDRRRELGSTTAAALGVAAALIGLLTAVLGLVKLTGGVDDRPGGSVGTSQTERPLPTPTSASPTPTSAAIYLNDESGPGGSVVKLSGEGFAPGETVTLRFHTEEVGRTRAGGGGSFSNVALTIPTSFAMFAPQQFDIVATGTDSVRSASAAFTLTG